MSEIRIALRRLTKSPGFTLAAVLTLGIGLAINGMFMNIANDLFFRPLPAADPEQLVLVAMKAPKLPYQLPFSYADAQDLRRFVDGDATAPKELAGVFSGIMAYKEQIVHLSESGKPPERTWVHAVTDNYFSGASRMQVLRRLALESTLLAIPAGIVGGLCALWLSPVLFSLAPGSSTTPPAAEVGADWRPFVLTGVLSLAAGLLAGIVPALRASSSSPIALMHSAAPHAFSPRHLFRSLMIVFQVAVSTVVLIGTLAALRSTVLLSHADLGFNTSGLYLTSFDLDSQRITRADAVRFQDELLRTVRALPGVEAASLTTGAPLTTGINMNGGIRAVDNPDAAGKAGFNAATIWVEHSYLSAIGLRIVSGRDFTERDKEKAPLVAIINEPLARTLWPGRNPLGQRLDYQGDTLEVVGVLPASPYYGIQDASRPLLVMPLAQWHRGNLTLVVRSLRPASVLSQQVTAAVRKINPEIPLFDSLTMEQHILRSPVGVMPYRVGAILAGVQGSVALVLSCAGIFSLVAFSVARRTREIGVRVALGATRSNVLGTVARGTLLLSGAGLALGLALGCGLLRFTSGLLYGGGASDLLLYLAAGVVITLVAVAACCIPAARALAINPMEALRAE